MKLINIKCSSCGETLLLFHSPGVMQHIFSLELHIYSLVAPIPAAQEVKLQVTRSKISYSLVKAHHFLVHQPVATNSMHLKSSHPQIYSMSSRISIWNPVGAPLLMFDGILNVTLSEEVSFTGVTQGNLKLPLSPD